MKKMYRARLLHNDVQEVDVISVTEKSVTFLRNGKTERNLIVSNYERYYEYERDAVMFLINLNYDAIDLCRKKIERYEDDIHEIKSKYSLIVNDNIV
jgi:hypothetical protein